MRTIVISAIVQDGPRVLLVRGPGEPWELPGGDLSDADETMEDGLSRILQQDFGLEVVEQEFVQTYYSPVGNEGGPAIQNLYRVVAWTGVPHAPPSRRDAEVIWCQLDEIDGMRVTEAALAALRDGASVSADAGSLPGAPVLIVAGPATEMKSAVVLELCRRLAPAAHVDADLIGSMLVSGDAQPAVSLTNLLVAAEHYELQRANVIAIATNFALAGIRSVVDLAVESDEQFRSYVEPLAAIAHVHCVSLLLGDVSATNEAAVGLQVEPIGLSVEEIVEQILTNCRETQIS